MRSFPILYLIIFLLFFLLVIFGSIKNIRKIVATQFKKPASTVFLIIHVLLLLVFIYLYIYPNQPREATDYTVYVIYNFILFSVLVFNLPNALSYLLHIILARKKSPVIPYTGFIIALGIVASMAYGMLFGSRQTKVVRHELTYPNLPAQFDGYKLFVFTDSHLGGMLYGKSLLNKAEQIVEETNPDLILFIGDLVNNFAYEVIGFEPYFHEVTKNIPSYSILGNHDYGDYSDWESAEKKQVNFDAILEANRELGFKLLLNEHVVLRRGEDSIFLAGVENWGHPPFPQYADLNNAIKDIAAETFSILLTHDPAHWESMIENKEDIELTLSGHTHGMQWGIKIAGIPFSLAYMQRKNWGGLYGTGNTYLHVNTGFGTVGVPWRLDMPAEFTVITLKRG